MAFNVDRWTSLLLGTLDRLADKDYQERSWFNRSANEISSPDEMLNELYDDLDFDEYLESRDVKLRDDQRRSGNLLKTKMDQFAAQTPKSLDPYEIVSNPEWDGIREAAAEFARVLRSCPPTS